jgi:hypothetical protein
LDEEFTTLDTWPYESWQDEWDDSTKEDRSAKLADYELLASGKLGYIDPDDPALVDPRKGFWEYDMEVRHKMKRPKNMPALELPLPSTFTVYNTYRELEWRLG